METKPTTEHGNIELTEAQAEIVDQFNYAFKNPARPLKKSCSKNLGRICFRVRRREGYLRRNAARSLIGSVKVNPNDPR